MKINDKFVSEWHPNPNTRGTVLIKPSLASVEINVLEASTKEFVSYMLAARQVSGELQEKLGVQRCAMIYKTYPGMMVGPILHTGFTTCMSHWSLTHPPLVASFYINFPQ